MATLFKKKYVHVPKLSFSYSIRQVGKNPFVDWLLIFFSSTFVALCLIGGGVYLYWQVTTGVIQSSVDVSASASRKFDQKSLSGVIVHIEAKEKATSQAKSGYSGPPDPSL